MPFYKDGPVRIDISDMRTITLSHHNKLLVLLADMHQQKASFMGKIDYPVTKLCLCG